MTITSFNLVYGIRLTRLDLYKWIASHPDHPWYKIVNDNFIQYKDEYHHTNLETYLEMLESNNMSDVYYDVHHELLTDLKFLTRESEFMDKNKTVSIFEITHDHFDENESNNQNDIVIGFTVLTVNVLYSYYDDKIDPESQFLTVYPKMNEWFINKIRNDPFIKDYLTNKNQTFRYYNIQNDCECCS